MRTVKNCVNADCRRLLCAHRARRVFDSSLYPTKEVLGEKSRSLNDSYNACMLNIDVK